jgi:hypothetical protein
MDWVKKIFPDMTDDQLKEFKKELPLHFVPSEQYNKKVDELKAKAEDSEAINKKLADNDKLMSELKSKAELTEEFKTKLEKAQTDYQQLENDSKQRLESVQKQSALERALTKAKAADDAKDLLIKDFDLSALELTDKGELKNADELMKSVMEKRPNLFVKEQLDGGKPADGKPDNNQADDTALRKLMGLKT